MASDSLVFGALTVAIVVGSGVLIAGVGAFEETVLSLVGVGSAIMVLGILGMAGYTSALPEPEGHEDEAGH